VKQRKKDRQRAVRRAVLVTTLGVVAIGCAIAVFVALRPTSVDAPGAQASAAPGPPAGAPVPADELEKAADLAGFHPTTSSSVGIVENLPADTTLLAPSATVLPVGIPAPDFTLSTPEGRMVRLSDFRGKTVLLEFFATWCPHCQAEAQHLPRLYESLPPSDFAFLSVNADSEDAGSIHAFKRYFKIPWPALIDGGTPAGSFKQAGGPGPVTKAYGIGLYPTFYIIDPRGRIAWRNDREQPDQLILQQLHNASLR
jgi:peroxiredoxin